MIAAAGYIWPSDRGFQAWVSSGHQPTAMPDQAALQAELAHRASLAEAAAKAWADGAEARAHAAAVERARRGYHDLSTPAILTADQKRALADRLSRAREASAVDTDLVISPLLDSTNEAA